MGKTKVSSQAIPSAPLAAACLVKPDQHVPYMSHLRKYRVEHRPLTLLLGFPPPAPAKRPASRDVDASLPAARRFARTLRPMPKTCLQFLLDETVHLLQAELASVSCFNPLVADVERRLGFRPTFGALDAAFSVRISRTARVVNQIRASGDTRDQSSRAGAFLTGGPTAPSPPTWDRRLAEVSLAQP
jgi:hypothetical protein